MKRRLTGWLLEGTTGSKKPVVHKKDAWWRVMCLTGTDYFSSMGFQPSIAYVAAGLLSPLATLNLVLLTLFGALPAYWVIARESPNGQGSFAIFERFLASWAGKTLVLILLGFAATDFIFTITMCAADATAHIVENPWVPRFPHDRMIVTLGLIATLAAVFLKGFQEAVKISFWLVAAYLSLNLIVLTVCVEKLLSDPGLIQSWLTALAAQYRSPLTMFTTAAFVFPQLALGLSGFETGVAVMTLIKTEDEKSIEQRIKYTRLLLVTVALIMGVFLLVGSLVTTVLIPGEMYAENGPANGRALAYLTHMYLGNAFGSIYDLSTVLILWFAGASGMAALLSLVPQYLPRYGMAPNWASARRPLVLFFTAVSFLITAVFRANVDAQAGAFATGLLVLVTSAAVAVTMVVWKRGWLLRSSFIVISAAFLYSSVAIILKRPDGLVISLCFIAAILISSLASRAIRSTELRVKEVKFDEVAESFIEQALEKHWGEIRILAHKPSGTRFSEKERVARYSHSIQRHEGDFIFLEVTPQDVSDFIDDTLEVSGYVEDCNQILRCASPSVPNAIAAILLTVRDKTNHVPHVYFEWTEGHPLIYVMKYVLLGEGETAPLTREILRSAEPDPALRPRVHVG